MTSRIVFGNVASVTVIPAEFEQPHRKTNDRWSILIPSVFREQLYFLETFKCFVDIGCRSFQ